MDAVSRKYISQLPQPLSKVKLLILLTLLDAGLQFPREWVESSKLLYLTNQKNFHRHVKELRDELGCDIEIQQVEGEVSYRLNSPMRKKPKPKPKPTLEETQREALLIYADYACQICGAKMERGQLDLQPDQKVPSSKGGSQELNNWQVICDDCNVAKRRYCNDCAKDCANCSWAYPELGTGVTLVRLPAELEKKLKATGVSSPEQLEKHIIASLERSFEADELTQDK